MCVGTAVLHCGQVESCFGFLASCARRLPVRALLCLRFGTAIVSVISRSGKAKPQTKNPRYKRGLCQHSGRNLFARKTKLAIVKCDNSTSRWPAGPPKSGWMKAQRGRNIAPHPTFGYCWRAKYGTSQPAARFFRDSRVLICEEPPAGSSRRQMRCQLN